MLTPQLYMINIYSRMTKETPKALFVPPISPAAPGPLYRQIVEGMKREIGEGRLKPGAPLPSFRVLAEDMMVSLITVKRAYEELEREGIIYRKQGLGTFVAEHGAERSRTMKRVRAEELMRQALGEAEEAGLTGQDFLDLAKRVIQTKGGQGDE